MTVFYIETITEQNVRIQPTQMKNLIQTKYMIRQIK